jgi:hypothetical protein
MFVVKSSGLVVFVAGRCVLQSKHVIAPVRAWTCSAYTQRQFIHNTQVCSCPTLKTKYGENLDADIKENLQKMREGKFEESEISHPEDLKHFRDTEPKTETQSSSNGDLLNEEALPPTEPLPMGAVALPHPIWSEEEVQTVQITHKEPEGFVDRMAFRSVKLLRGTYDLISGFNTKERTELMWLNRLALLETVAGVPGMVAAMVRHLHSLRKLRRDHGWIHTLLEEAENERMHLMTVLQLKKPSWMFRMMVLFTQGVFVNGFSLAYLLSPHFCHRFVGYLEEEAVVTYSKLLKDMDSGPMKHWNTTPAPEVAISYWHLLPDATMKDVILAIRADEAHHRVVNHTLGSMKAEDYNPYGPGK